VLLDQTQSLLAARPTIQLPIDDGHHRTPVAAPPSAATAAAPATNKRSGSSARRFGDGGRPAPSLPDRQLRRHHQHEQTAPAPAPIILILIQPRRAHPADRRSGQGRSVPGRKPAGVPPAGGHRRRVKQLAHPSHGGRLVRHRAQLLRPQQGLPRFVPLHGETDGLLWDSQQRSGTESWYIRIFIFCSFFFFGQSMIPLVN